MFHSFSYKRKCLARKYIDVIYYEFLKKSRGNGTVPANNGHVCVTRVPHGGTFESINPKSFTWRWLDEKEVHATTVRTPVRFIDDSD